jgi:DNA-binding beta-propeller fold protein YncE
VADDGALRRVDLVDRTVTTVAGRSGSPGYEDGSAVRARLGYLIHAIVVTPDGRTALLADRSNDVIRAVDLESYEIRTVSGTSAGWQGPGGLAFDPESSSPTEVWVADTFADRIRSIDIGSGTVTEIASVPSPQGLVLYDGAILAMGFEPSIMRIEPGTGRTSVFFDDFGGSFASPIAIDGSLVYADLARGSIRQLALGTRTDTSIAGSERPRGHVDGSASEARFEFITDLATSVDGHVLFIADAGNGALRRARFAAGESAVVDTVTIEGLDTPAGLALTDDGDRLAISDYMTGRVYVLALDPMGEVVSETTIASGLEGPLGISWDLDGSLYVAEAEAARIARIAPDGTVSVHAGTGTAGTNDGPALEASFTAPSGVIASPDGLLITDEGAGALRFSDFASGEVVTLTSGSAPGEVHDGTLADATWGEPVRAVALEAGRWLVIDREAGVVRYVERGTPGVVRTVVGSPLRTGGLASGATVPLERAALGAASAIVRIEGGWLVSTETAVHRIEGDVLAAR